MIDDVASFWDELLAFVEARSIIPVIVPDFTIVKYDGRRETYQQVLPRQLAIRLTLTNVAASPSLHEYVGVYLERPGAKRQAIYREPGDLASKFVVGTPEPFLHLGMRKLPISHLWTALAGALRRCYAFVWPATRHS